MANKNLFKTESLPVAPAKETKKTRVSGSKKKQVEEGTPAEAVAVVPVAEPSVEAPPVDQPTVVESAVEAGTPEPARVEQPLVEPQLSAKQAKKMTTGKPKATSKRIKQTSTKKTEKKKDKGISMIAAAELVLAKEDKPMACKEMIEAMAERGLWTSPHGLTPAATLYSSILRLIERDGKKAKFRKVDRGLFDLNK